MSRAGTRRAFVWGTLATGVCVVLARHSTGAGPSPQAPAVGAMDFGDALVRLRPSSFEHLIAVVALYRPGPLECGLFDEYVERRHGRRKLGAGPVPRELLEDTYGLIVYEDQLVRIATAVAGLDAIEAERFLRALVVRDRDELVNQRAQFLVGAARHGHSGETADRLFDELAHFATYSTRRDHCAEQAARVFGGRDTLEAGSGDIRGETTARKRAHDGS